MKTTTLLILENLVKKIPSLEPIKNDILKAFDLLSETFHAGGKLLVCGNGGSASDADHIVGELMKDFQLKRSIDDDIASTLRQIAPDSKLPEQLQSALPAINLSAHTAFVTAMSNDSCYDLIFAQQIFGYGKKGDILLGISTSGNSKNINNAAIVAKALEIKSIGLTGFFGGRMPDLFDVVIKVPNQFTAEIQEMHLPVYHTLCAMLEDEFFWKGRYNRCPMLML